MNYEVEDEFKEDENINIKRLENSFVGLSHENDKLKQKGHAVFSPSSKSKLLSECKEQRFANLKKNFLPKNQFSKYDSCKRIIQKEELQAENEPKSSSSCTFKILI